MNLPGIFGLHASVGWLAEHQQEVHEHEQKLVKRMLDGIRDVEGIRIAGMPTEEGQSQWFPWIFSMTITA